jgi:hypothetical protein
MPSAGKRDREVHEESKKGERVYCSGNERARDGGGGRD